jgi:hypothetical protein
MAMGSQNFIQITPRILSQTKSTVKVRIRAQVGTLNLNKTEIKNLALLSLKVKFCVSFPEVKSFLRLYF